MRKIGDIGGGGGGKNLAMSEIYSIVRKSMKKTQNKSVETT